jgi:hypothetical protein
MIYLSPQADPWRYGVSGDHWGIMVTPKRRGVALPAGRRWGADIGMASDVAVPEYVRWLAGLLPVRRWCLFVVVPDVLCDAVATLDRFRWWAWRIKAAGWKVALVGQDGLESLRRWPPAFDCLFVGGSTEWKMSDAAAWCIARAKRRYGAWVHVGRVNSQRRIRHFQYLGVDSVDGTTVAFSPDKMYRRLDRQLRQPPLC